MQTAKSACRFIKCLIESVTKFDWKAELRHLCINILEMVCCHPSKWKFIICHYRVLILKLSPENQNVRVGMPFTGLTPSQLYACPRTVFW